MLRLEALHQGREGKDVEECMEHVQVDEGKRVDSVCCVVSPASQPLARLPQPAYLRPRRP